MKKTYKEIIENQEKFKNEILLFLVNDLKEAKADLSSIESKDDYILSEKKKLEYNFKKANKKFRPSFEKLFFMHPNRDKIKFVWWDEKKEQAVILNYEK